MKKSFTEHIIHVKVLSKCYEHLPTITYNFDKDKWGKLLENKSGKNTLESCRAHNDKRQLVNK